MLRDGGTAHVRPISPDDAELLVDFYADVSPQSKYYRFFAAMPTLSPREVQRFVDVDHHDRVAEDFGCYVLEVGRRAFGGRYLWHDGRRQPVLVVGEPACRVAILAWDKCRGRLLGEEADNIPFFFAGFAERVRRLEPGTDVLVV